MLRTAERRYHHRLPLRPRPGCTLVTSPRPDRRSQFSFKSRRDDDVHPMSLDGTHTPRAPALHSNRASHVARFCALSFPGAHIPVPPMPAPYPCPALPEPVLIAPVPVPCFFPARMCPVTSAPVSPAPYSSPDLPEQARVAHSCARALSLPSAHVQFRDVCMTGF